MIEEKEKLGTFESVSRADDLRDEPGDFEWQIVTVAVLDSWYRTATLNAEQDQDGWIPGSVTTTLKLRRWR